MHDVETGARWGAALAAGALALTLAGPAAAQDGAVTYDRLRLARAGDGLRLEPARARSATQAAADSIGAAVIDASGAGYGDVGPTLNSLKEDGAQFIVAQASGYGDDGRRLRPRERHPRPRLGATRPDSRRASSVTPRPRAQEGGYLAGRPGCVDDPDRPARRRALGERRPQLAEAGRRLRGRRAIGQPRHRHPLGHHQRRRLWRRARRQARHRAGHRGRR